MRQFITGILFVLFGLLVGGVGVASAAIGIGIPMIPIGVYLVIRGLRTMFAEKASEADEIGSGGKKLFESTRGGGILFGILLILIGAATSALLIGIPIILVGIWMTVYNIRRIFR